MAKKTYYCPELPQNTRTTDRTYTHIIASSTSGYAYTWCGRYDLALTQLAHYRKHDPGAKMLPVEVQEKKTKKNG